jgi:hypothetical protein
MALNETGISNIVAAVGLSRTPNKLDRDQLRQNLEAAWDSYQGYLDESGRRTRTERSKRAAKIARLAGELLKLLEDPKHIKLIDMLSFSFPICEGAPVLGADWETGPGGAPMHRAADSLRRHQAPSFGGLKAGLIQFKFVAERVARERTNKSAMRTGFSPLMWLIGKELVDVYELAFRKKAGRSRRGDTGRKPYGPFLRFVAAVMQEFGKPVSDHTTEMVIKRVRALKRRTRLT